MTERVHTTAEIDVWGTIVFVEVASTKVGLDELNAGLAEVTDYVKVVDQEFSTYKPDSQVSKIRRGELKIEDASAQMQEVWELCLKARDLTGGSFDPWVVKGGYDPSGYVKGWAADKCVQILKRHGAENIQVNAAGDLVLAGGFENGKPWSIGVRSPENRFEVVKVFEITDGAIATSGTYEIGAHIKDPHTGLIAIGARSATVIGPDGGLADALATSLVVAGQDGAAIFMKPELSEYRVWVIPRNEDIAWSIGKLTE
jgi:thiamine biosynthesis lipoprotein